MGVSQVELIFSLLQQMCVYLVIAYLLSKTPLFIPLRSLTPQASVLPHVLYVLHYGYLLWLAY